MISTRTVHNRQGNTVDEQCQVDLSEEESEMSPSPPPPSKPAAVTGGATNDDMVRLMQSMMDKFEAERTQMKQDHNDQVKALSDRLDKQSQNRSQAGNSAPKVTVKSPQLLQDDVTLKKFNSWFLTWENYAVQVKLAAQPREEQLASFWSFCSPELMTMMKHSVKIPRDTKKTLEELVTDLRAFLGGKQNLTLDRLNFSRCKQRDGESFDQFYANLCEMADIGNMRKMTFDDWLSNAIVVGVLSEETRQHVLEKSPALGLDDLVKFCRQQEISRLHQAGLNKASKAEQVTVAANQERRQSQGQDRVHFEKRCDFCGLTFHRGDVCPAKDQSCNYCKKKGHYRSVCLFRKAKDK